MTHEAASRSMTKLNSFHFLFSWKTAEKQTNKSEGEKKKKNLSGILEYACNISKSKHVLIWSGQIKCIPSLIIYLTI